jgi:hypothetical protein
VSDKHPLTIAEYQALLDAAAKGSEDASAAVAKYKKDFKTIGSKLRADRDAEKLRKQEHMRQLDSQRDLNSLWTAIREFVWAETRLVHAQITLGKDHEECKKQQEQSTRMETSVREQLEILKRLSSATRRHHDSAIHALP